MCSLALTFSIFYSQRYAVDQLFALVCMKTSLKILQAILEEMEQKRIRYLRLLRASRWAPLLLTPPSAASSSPSPPLRCPRDSILLFCGHAWSPVCSSRAWQRPRQASFQHLGQQHCSRGHTDWHAGPSRTHTHTTDRITLPPRLLYLSRWCVFCCPICRAFLRCPLWMSAHVDRLTAPEPSSILTSPICLHHIGITHTHPMAPTPNI